MILKGFQKLGKLEQLILNYVNYNRNMVAAFYMLTVQCSLWLIENMMRMKFPVNVTEKGDVTVK